MATPTLYDHPLTPIEEAPKRDWVRLSEPHVRPTGTPGRILLALGVCLAVVIGLGITALAG